MEKSIEGLIIDVPWKLSRLQRTTDGSFTVIATVVWLVALRPLIAIVLWYVGWDLAYLHMVRLEGLNNRGYFALLGLLGLVILFVMFLWSRYNALRFGGLDRRKARACVTPAEMAAFFALPVEGLERAQNATALMVTRSARVEIGIACGDGSVIVGRHDPQGPRPGRPG